MGIPGFPFLRDYRNPIVIIGTPLACKPLADDTDGAYNTVDTVNMSGAEWPSIYSGQFR